MGTETPEDRSAATKIGSRRDRTHQQVQEICIVTHLPNQIQSTFVNSNKPTTRLERMCPCRT
ncbi:unnamed protein product [Acanthoscelides obtectus]|uniref:Uncharacterized protein n=1 Tax=Acanthoscelides obtectus TaxID=200917 RepID=A0A9P0JYB6_ACAOB|nr:unnamed protein product [Acanthoscelides obtectus]CAK1646085.1 hypothetical protein AOBTE_LOCUS14445 [Acanthoscelides obtectus]